MYIFAAPRFLQGEHWSFVLSAEKQKAFTDKGRQRKREGRPLPYSKTVNLSVVRRLAAPACFLVLTILCDYAKIRKNNVSNGGRIYVGKGNEKYNHTQVA